MEELHRVFIGGLFDAITKDELQNRFQSFGEVSDVTIVHKRDGEGNITKTFGYVNLKTTTPKLNKCFALFGGTKWKGQELKVQLAKEDFMARLQRERNEPPPEKKKKKKSMAPTKTYTDILETTSTMRRIVPGTPVEGEKNWVISKYGRPLPIMYVPKLGSKKTIKIDPSKFCHCLKRLPDKDDDLVNVDTLTWSLDDTITKIKKKKKKKRECDDDVNIESEVNGTCEDLDTEPIKKKKKKDKENNIDSNESISLSEITTNTTNVDKNISEEQFEECSIKKKKKKKKRDSEISENAEENIADEESEVELLKKKKKRKEKTEKENSNDMDIDETELEQNTGVETSIANNIETNKDYNTIIDTDEFIIPETLFEGSHDESVDSDDENDKSILSKSIVEQLIEKKNAAVISSSSESCEEETGVVLSNSIVDQLSTLKKKSIEKTTPSNDEGEIKQDIDSESEEEENLFDFEFEDMAGKNKKAFLEKYIISNIEVRNDTDGISDASSDADESSSDDEDELEKKPIEKTTPSNTEGGSKQDNNSKSEEKEEENLFDFELEDMKGETKKAFLEKLVSNIEVRTDTDGISDASSDADESSSDDEDESDIDDNKKLLCAGTKGIDEEESEESISTESSVTTAANSTADKDATNKNIENEEKELKPKKTKKKDKESGDKKTKIQNSNKQEKHALSEEKRQKSVEARNSQIQQNKGLVSKALKDVDSKTAPTNRIVFSDNESDDDDTPISINTEITSTAVGVSESKDTSSSEVVSKAKKPGIKQLFDDSESEEEENSEEEEIVVKPQFQGKEGEKLFKLQQKFGGDERFKLDERFAENREEEEEKKKKVESTGSVEEDGEENEEEDTHKEKEMNMSILEQVLGKPLTGEKKEREYLHQRYDPDNADHEKFEVKDESAEGNEDDDDGLPKKKKKKEKAPKVELPEVSKETFFDVKESIKDLFGKGGESAAFSFFGGGGDNSNDNQDDDEEAHAAEDEEEAQEPMEVENEAENVKIKEPSWKRGLEEMNSHNENQSGDGWEVAGTVTTEEKKEIFDKKHTFLYIPKDDERLEAGKRFKRTEEIEEVTNQWRALRKTLTEDYKKKHKDAVRRVRKMREKRYRT